MSKSVQQPDVSDSQSMLTALTQLMEQFVCEWETKKSPPDLNQFIQSKNHPNRFLLIELIKIDLEFRWSQYNFPKRVIEYFEEYPTLLHEAVPVDLLYEEFHLRRQNGFDADPAEFLNLFPTVGPQLEQLFELNHDFISTQIFKQTEPEAFDCFQPGDTVDDFDLLTLLGKGAFAKVYQARQNSMQRLVALKISGNSSAEPQTLAQLDHDNIVRVYDQRLISDQKIRLLYMQYLPGGTLQPVADLIRKTAPAERSGKVLLAAINQSLDLRGVSRPAESLTCQTLKSLSWPETICWLGIRLANALDYAHEKGILHRDIKPANVLLTEEGIPKLADFNISFSSHVAGTTPAAYFGGSLSYMSPEQLEAYDPTHSREPESLDERSDLYSLGLMLWELLTGTRPFPDPSIESGWSAMLKQMIQHRHAGPSLENTPQHLPPDCPEHLLTVLQKCLDPDPDNRWNSGADLASQFELCLNPRAQQILFPSPKSWFTRLKGWEIPLIVIIVAIPNILAGLFNFFHNQKHIVEHLQNSQDAFWQIQSIINLIAYPLGLGLIGWLTWTILRFQTMKATDDDLDDHKAAVIQSRCLRLGHYAALICITEWIIAGIAYPVSMHFAIGSLPITDYLHFLGSLLLCGLIAASYPFFGVTYISLHAIYPQLLQANEFRQQTPQMFSQMKRLTWIYLIMAFLVPTLSIAGLALINLDDKFAIGLLTVAGTLGAVSIFQVFQSLHADLDALSELYSSNQP